MRLQPQPLLLAVVVLFVLGSCAEDLSQGEDPECGNGVAETGEQCDGNDLGGGSCVALGFETGILTCTGQCMFDTGNCADIERDCGNGLLDGDEACDDGNLGNGDGCDFNCNVETGFECTGEPSVCTGDTCGNGTLEPANGELCESGDLDGQNCLTLGFDGGMLSCGPDCNFNTSQCTGGPCGNGSLDPGEACDGANLDGETCLSQGFLHGTLACLGDCTLDTALCSNDPCGNGTVDASELCDGADLDGETCVSQGFLHGTLACLGDCTFDSALCSNDPCGDGIADPGNGEQCDGADLGGQTCVGLGYLTGSLACAAGCVFDESACANNLCGNGTVEPPEQCDDGNVAPNDGCSGTCQWEGQCTPDFALTCGVQVSGALLMSTDALTNYSCGVASAALGDHVYSFVAGGTGLANAALDVIEEDPLFADEIDLYVLEGACIPSQCIAAGNNVGDELFTFPVQAGMTYYVVVETVAWGLLSQIDYDLTVSCP